MCMKRVSSGTSRFSALFSVTGPARTPAGTGAQARAGFTLIELLVVVAIIALLVSILIPSVQEAQYLANLVVCASNYHQIGVGLGIYLNDWDNKYFPPWNHPTIFHTTETWLMPIVDGQAFDNRQNLSDIAGGATMIYYCPLSPPEWWPQASEVNADPWSYWTKWADRYYVTPASNNYRHTMAYNLFLVAYNPNYYDFSGTDNPNGESPRLHPGSERAATTYDLHETRGNKLRYSNLLGQWVDWDPGNVLYGDGHAAPAPGRQETQIVIGDFGNGPFTLGY